jgi:uncharacterized protein (DUF2252 family)
VIGTSDCHASIGPKIRPLLFSGPLLANIPMSNLMMPRFLTLLVLLLIPSVLRAADPPAEPRPFDLLRNAYGPYVDANDPLAFPAKVRALSSDRYAFWRGAKDLFFLWCKNNTQRWLDDKQAYVVQEGDQHLGNVGTYMTGRNFGTLAFGMVDFDDSHRLPFQFELLQGIITLRLAAEEKQVSLDDDQLDQLISLVLEHYERGATSANTATDLLADDPTIVHMKIRLAKKNYGKELNEYTADSMKIRPFAPLKKPKDVFRPAMDKADPIANGIAQAIARSPQMVRIFNYHTADDIRAHMKDVALRTRMGSAGSQGLKKFFVLLNKPLVGVDHDAILYIKQQVPTAAERSGIIPRDPRTPGQRCAEDMDLLSHPPPFLNSWFQMGNEHYWVTLREPWTDELESDDIKDLAGLRQMAKLWATAAGASHRVAGEGEMIRKRIGPELSNELRRFSNAYLLKLAADYDDFKADPRCAPLIARANETLDAIKASVPAVSPEKRKDN